MVAPPVLVVLPIVAATADGAPSRSQDEQDNTDDHGDDAEGPENANVEQHCEDKQNDT